MAATAAVYSRLHNSSVVGGGLGAGVGSSGGIAHSQLARSLERILEEAHLSGELILTNRKLKDFPKTGTKYNLVDTVMADLSRNRFCELPEEITSFSFLETLLLYHNTIRSIPESVKHLTSLTYLDLRSNQLGLLPREICFLPLQVLLVSNNRLTSLPDELGRMDRLTDLDASYNQLSSLPARIGELRSLRSLSLRSNHLMYLPRELTCLTLVSLDVSNNRVASLPLEIRQMTTLVELNLENNPLTSPPASLCVRGLVHVFKFLETQAAKDDKGSRAGGNYDGYTTLRRTPRLNPNGSVLESNRVPRHNVDSGYSTCDGIDKRWSHDMPNVKGKTDSPAHKMPSTPPSAVLRSELMDASLTSSSSTIVDESISSITSAAEAVLPLNIESPMNHKTESTILDQITHAPASLQHINTVHSSSSNGSSPDQEDGLLDHYHNNNQNGKTDDKASKPLSNIQTYREYKEALKQQRNLEVSSVYKIKGNQQMLYDMSEASNALNSLGSALNNEENESRSNGIVTNNMPPPKSIMKNCTNLPNTSNGAVNGGDDYILLPKKPIQKVIPSRNTEIMSSQVLPKLHTDDVEKSCVIQNGVNSCVDYVKPCSPMKTLNGSSSGTSASAILANNSKITPITGLKSSVSGTSKLGIAKTHRTVTWNHDIPPEKLSFTMRREFDRQREETELMTQLRSIIETRLKMTLPEDIASALTDGVILCHLANYVRPRSVASIHVPSPGVSKLTMARCRRNVDNFLEACRKIGVDEELICSCADIVPPSDQGCNNNSVNNKATAHFLQDQTEHSLKLPNPSAVLKTVSALIAMDFNPHHQNIRNLQQQYELKQKLQKQEQQRHHHFETLDKLNCGSHDVMQNGRKSINEHENEYEHQHTATRTKEQMQQTHGQDNSTFNLSAKCHFDVTVLSNGNGGSDKEHDNEDDVDGNALIKDDSCISDKLECSNNITNFFRHAKLKTFQKIKFNLLSSGEMSSGHDHSNNNHCMLQTIVETESEVGGGGSGSGGDGYHLINEKPKLNEELQLKIERTASYTGANKYKLIDVTTIQNNERVKTDNSVAIVSKHIEFFEHSTVGIGSINAANIQCSTTDIKPKAKNKIFSIYRVAEAPEEKQTKSEVLEEEAGSSFLLKHDSHVLTIVLSCVFILTFLLLVFFPLPG